jgi:hypothetical protein
MNGLLSSISIKDKARERKIHNSNKERATKIYTYIAETPNLLNL